MIENYEDIDSEIVLHVIVLKMSYLFMINYNYLVVDSINNQAVIVDPAWNMGKIDQALANTRTSLCGILLTHSHPDHVHLAKPLAAKYQCPIWMSNEEIIASGFNDKRLIGIDMTPWSVGQIQIQPIFTPGHTSGSMCYLLGDNLFTGDTLFAEGCGLCFNTHAAYNMYASLEYLKNQIKPQTHIYPGHCYGKLPGQEFSLLLKENMYLQFKNKEQFAAYRLRKGQSISSVFNFI